jgi:hypothetical protein
VNEFLEVHGQGLLENGGNHTGNIAAAGERDVWTFNAEEGEHVHVRVSRTSGAAAFAPVFGIYDAGTNLVGTATAVMTPGNVSARLDYIAESAGAFTLVVGSGASEETGNYRVDFMRVPEAVTIPSGETGGPIGNEGRHDGAIAVGDLDAWSFSATPGDLVELRVAQLSGGNTFVPRVRIFDADGVKVGEASGSASGSAEARGTILPQSTNDHIVVIDSATPEGTGNYRLQVMRLPGEVSTPSSDTGGELANGGNHDGAIAIGDLDAWTFTADAGEMIFLRAAQTSGGTDFAPRIRVYDATGTMVAGDVAQNTATSEARVDYPSAESGTFTVVVDSWLVEGAGNYRLFYLKLPGTFSTPSGDDGANLANTQDGNTTVGDLDVWSFEASAGDRVKLEARQLTGGETYAPRMRVFDESGRLVAHGHDRGTASSHTNSVTFLTPTNGVFNVVVDSSLARGSGGYRLEYTRNGGPFTHPSADGSELSNGGNFEGGIEGTEEDRWTFAANAGERVLLRATRLTGHSSWFRPWVRLYGPDGELITSGDAAADPDNGVQFIATESATYTVAITSYYEEYDGTYRLHYLKMPGTASVPGGDDGGVLANGGNHEGTLTIADMDPWTFTANAGERVLLRATRLTGHTSWFRPWVRLYGPDGSFIAAGDAQGDQDNGVDFVATETATFTAVLSSYYAGYEGTYRLHYVKIPGTVTIPGGDDGGALENGGNFEGTLTAADLDTWTLTANAGERVALRASRLTGHTSWFRPWVRVYGPEGRLVASGDAADNHDNGVNFIATETASYSVVISSYYASYDGTYRLHCLKIPGTVTIPGGDDGGLLGNGGNHEGTLTIGDLDAWNFPATAGNRVLLRASRLTGHESWFRPWVRIYGPDGRLVAAGDAADNHDNGINFVAEETTTYTVVMSSYYVGYDGTYRLHFYEIPKDFTVPGGDEGGSVLNGANQEGTLTVADLDAYTFNAVAGDRILLRACRITGHLSWFRPWIRLYGPDGRLVAAGDAAGNHDNVVDLTLNETGRYTAIVSSYYSGYEGTYRLTGQVVADPFTVPGGDEGGFIVLNQALEGVINEGDMDFWTFEADGGQLVTLQLEEVTGGNSFSPWLQVFSPTGELLGSHTHASLAELTVSATHGGIFTVVGSSGLAGGTGTYRLTTTNLPIQGLQLRHSAATEETFTVNWPSVLAEEFVLQQNTSAAIDGWEDVEIEVMDNGLNARITIPIETGGRRFFRLKDRP